MVLLLPRTSFRNPATAAICFIPEFRFLSSQTHQLQLFRIPEDQRTSFSTSQGLVSSSNWVLPRYSAPSSASLPAISASKDATPRLLKYRRSTRFSSWRSVDSRGLSSLRTPNGSASSSLPSFVNSEPTVDSFRAKSDATMATPCATTFEPLPERPDFPKEEERILADWNDRNTFKRSVEMSKGKPIFTFYDGPPFATGLPHYGHILAGTIKDVVTRYAHQTGHYVDRRFGWDCHGLPVEFEIDKSLGITSRHEIVEMGIDKYNDKCRSIVMRYASEWRSVIERMGRWIDFDNDYKTLDTRFMESVWWVFKQLFDKGLVYRANKIMPFSTACSTPLSNFEANQNYKDVKDPSIVIAFSCVEESGGVPLEFLAWTTTPWTLPSNLALCVNPELTYIQIRNKETKKDWVLCESRIDWLLKQLKMDLAKDFEVVDRFPGAALKGKKYQPLFDFFNKEPRKDENIVTFRGTAFRVVADAYVSDDSGTGIVHCAPAFGEDDFRVCMEQGIIVQGGHLPCPVDDNGLMTAEVGPELSNLYIKDADKVVKKLLKAADRLVVNADCVHAYPHCWRSDTPLIYRAVPSWFVRVEHMRERLVEANEQTYWVPSFVKEKRFKNWLAEARDWCVSRNRFWGTPIPLWTSEDFSQIVCIGSLEELHKYTDKKLTDIHRHFIDDITIPDPRGPSYPPLRRVPEVFDCWFESGSMPYGQIHYPFENAATFEKGFPADFIAEGLDQTRGWFYTLMVISTALFDRPPFKNLIVNGLVLAADGRKMSKRLKNYPDPTEVIHVHGADALRVYLVNSPVVKAEALRFRIEGVKDVVKDVFLPWFHACRFLIQEVIRYETSGDRKFEPCKASALISKGNNMDRWIISSTQSLVKFFHQEMKAYRLYTVVPRLLHFLDQLTNWYVRLNRDRMRGTMGEEEAATSLQTLFDVLLTTVLCMAPLTPFMSELLYRNLKRALPESHSLLAESVHFLTIPEAAEDVLDSTIERQMGRMQTVINIGRAMRERQRVPVKTPVRCLTVFHADTEYTNDIRELEAYVKEELNVLDLNVSSDMSGIQLSATPNFKSLGARLGKDMRAVQEAVKNLSHAELVTFEKTARLEVLGGKHVLGADDLTLRRTLNTGDKADPNLVVEGDNSVVVLMDFTPDDSLQRKALAREVANRVQKLRKQHNLSQTDDVKMHAFSEDSEFNAMLQGESAYICACLRRALHVENPLGEANGVEKSHQMVCREALEVGGKPLTILFLRQ
ncbi:UNVERIFIED_CONTAM: isoleucyl-tRNA synthetase family protein [Hammondia hammondi]|eukprot:XP_008886926.1 isoleucyl-tRNA synthetase family protein [Hammondia hammondi]